MNNFDEAFTKIDELLDTNENSAINFMTVLAWWIYVEKQLHIFGQASVTWTYDSNFQPAK